MATVTAAGANVKIAYGEIAGQVQDTGVLEFIGVPFAAPPVGELRFAPPRNPEPWTGTKQCVTYPALGPQDDLLGMASAGLTMSLGQIVGRLLFRECCPCMGPEQNSEGLRADMSEDCLYLNIWTPQCDGKRRPVFFYIPGGALMSGGTYDSFDQDFPWDPEHNLYDGKHFCLRGDVVVVVVGYRLGLLGFGSLPVAGANWGFQDQLHALKFVKQNIASFGGDAGNVTICGESAGGISVFAHLASPMSRGFFHKAISHSGCGPPVSKAFVEPRLPLIAKGLGLETEQLADLAELRSVPVRSFVRATGALKKAGVVNGAALCPPAVQPVYGDEFLPVGFFAAYAAGSAAGIPIMLGHTKHETKAFKNFGLVPPEGKDRYIDYALKVFMGNCGYEVEDTPEHREAISEALGEVYDEYVRLCEERGDSADLHFILDTDGQHKANLFRALPGLKAHGSNIFYFRFDVESTNGLGACHGLDIPYIFGTNETCAADIVPTGAAAIQTSERVMDAWAAFMRTGNPSTAHAAWPKVGADCQAMLIKDGGFELGPSFLPDMRAWGRMDLAVTRDIGKDNMGAAGFFQRLPPLP